MKERQAINHRLVYELRHAHRPVNEMELATLYDEDPDAMLRDVDTLRRYALVQTTPAGVCWVGS